MLLNGEEQIEETATTTQPLFPRNVADFKQATGLAGAH
jgi:hypothetical protein